MHDTFLFKNISDSLAAMCEENNIKKILYLEVDVHDHSHVNSESLLDYLIDNIPDLVDEDTNVLVEIGEDVNELTAMIRVIEGQYDEAIPD